MMLLEIEYLLAWNNNNDAERWFKLLVSQQFKIKETIQQAWAV